MSSKFGSIIHWMSTGVISSLKTTSSYLNRVKQITLIPQVIQQLWLSKLNFVICPPVDWRHTVPSRQWVMLASELSPNNFPYPWNYFFIIRTKINIKEGKIKKSKMAWTQIDSDSLMVTGAKQTCIFLSRLSRFDLQTSNIQLVNFTDPHNPIVKRRPLITPLMDWNGLCCSESFIFHTFVKECQRERDCWL